MTEAMPALRSAPSPFAGSEWFDPLQEAVRCQVRSFIEQLLEEELEAALGRRRYERSAIGTGRASEKIASWCLRTGMWKEVCFCPYRVAHPLVAGDGQPMVDFPQLP